MAGNYAGVYFLTSRAGEQLPNSMSRKKEEKATPEILSNYISTTSQNSLVNKEENSAIKYNAISNISLVKNNAVNSYNSMMKKIQQVKNLGI